MDLESFGKLSLIHPAMQTLLVVFSFGLTNTLSLIFYVGHEAIAFKLVRIVKSWVIMSISLFVLAFCFVIGGLTLLGLNSYEVIGALIFLQLLSLLFILGTYFQFGKFYLHYLINQIGFRFFIVFVLCCLLITDNSISFFQFIFLSITILTLSIGFLIKSHVNFNSFFNIRVDFLSDLKQGVPLIFNGIVSYFVIVAPRLSLAANSDNNSLLYFSVLQTFVAVLTIFYASLSRIFSPNIFKLTVCNDINILKKYVDRLLSNFSAATAMAVSFIAFVTAEFSNIYFKSHNIDINLVILLCIPFLFQLLYATHVDILYASKKGLFVTCLLVASATSTYFSSNFMYSEYGVLGVAFATSFNIVMQYILVFLLARYLLGSFALDLRSIGWFFAASIFLILYVLSVDKPVVFITLGVFNFAIFGVVIYKSLTHQSFSASS